MSDRFLDVINRYLLPMERLERVIDSSYFLRANLSFAFAQGYCHPPDGFYGKMINYPDPGGALDIFGRRYANTNKRRRGNGLELIPIDEQLELHYSVEPALKRREGMPPFAEYHVRFPLSGCTGYFDHRHSLRTAMETHPLLQKRVPAIASFLELPQERLGVTGSLSYGRLEDEDDDIDLAVYVTVDEQWQIARRIRDLVKRPEHQVIEFGKFWPMRFFYDGTLICPFFIYADPGEIPLASMTMETIAEPQPFSGRVCDDRHGAFLPILLELERVQVGPERVDRIQLIIYDSSVRGEYVSGDVITGTARLVRVTTPANTYRALLVTTGTAISGGGRRRG
ncbi:MAG: hypothetical protein NT045_08605 [Candidatus Aureabacteria bacterium]|nr:hypothetical protein [Candidatus Auribacterota bacterium]